MTVTDTPDGPGSLAGPPASPSGSGSESLHHKGSRIFALLRWRINLKAFGARGTASGHQYLMLSHSGSSQLRLAMICRASGVNLKAPSSTATELDKPQTSAEHSISGRRQNVRWSVGHGGPAPVCLWAVPGYAAGGSHRFYEFRLGAAPGFNAEFWRASYY